MVHSAASESACASTRTMRNESLRTVLSRKKENRSDRKVRLPRHRPLEQASTSSCTASPGGQGVQRPKRAVYRRHQTAVLTRTPRRPGRLRRATLRRRTWPSVLRAFWAGGFPMYSCESRGYRIIATANSTTRTSSPIASGHKLSLGELVLSHAQTRAGQARAHVSLPARCHAGVEASAAYRDADAREAHVQMHARQNADASLKP
jgi:hypothetical protein